MGDRANIVIEYDNGDEVYLYTHWQGYRLPVILRDALARGRDRWQDEAYLARIVFSEMINGSKADTTGFGIAPYPCDNERPYLRVNPKTQTVTVDYGPVRKYHNRANIVIPFSEYAMMGLSGDGGYWEQLQKGEHNATKTARDKT